MPGATFQAVCGKLQRATNMRVLVTGLARAAFRKAGDTGSAPAACVGAHPRVGEGRMWVPILELGKGAVGKGAVGKGAVEKGFNLHKLPVWVPILELGKAAVGCSGQGRSGEGIQSTQTASVGAQPRVGEGRSG
eukprot:365797-Chlamydomonas_euryale.AAC.4